MPDHAPAPKSSTATAPLLVPIDRGLLADVKIAIEVRLGNAEMSVDSLMNLKSGSVVILDKEIGDPVGLYLNGACIARGEIVAVGDRFGVRILQIAGS